MIRVHRQLLVSLALLGLTAAAPHARMASATFVVSPHSALRDLSSSELRRIFLGQTSRWRDRHRIVLCLPPTRSPEETLLLDRVVRMSAIDYSQQWVGAVFRGEVAAVPRVFGSRQALLEAVAENPYAIGVVATTEETIEPAVAITVDGKSPDDPAYPVRR
jgi:ABC-type phosphate transport system substrate-binding protein